MPKIGDSDAVWANSHNFYISKQGAADENKLQASKVFIDWMSKHSADWAGAGMIPARKSVREEAAVTDSTQASGRGEDRHHEVPAAGPRPG